MPPARGGTIKAITEKVSPAKRLPWSVLPAPSDREKSQIFVQRYMQHFPAGGEIVIFDRKLVQPRRRRICRVASVLPDEHWRFLSLCLANRENILPMPASS